MRFVIFCKRSRERSQRTSRPISEYALLHAVHITVEVEPRIAKQYKCQYCCSCKNYCGKGMEGGKKCLCVVFLLPRRSRVRRKKCVLGHPIARAASYCLLPNTLWLRASKNAFKAGSVKFANSLSHRLPLWRKYAPEVKAAKGFKRCRGKSQGS